MHPFSYFLGRLIGIAQYYNLVALPDVTLALLCCMA
jgi:hypothetical protein